MSSVLFSRARRSGVALAIAGAFLLGGSATAAPINQNGKAPGGPAATPAPLSMLPQGVGPAVLPTFVPGTRWLVLNSWDAVPLNGGAGATMVTGGGAGFNWVYSSPGGFLIVPLNLPYGALIYQVDVYGYRTGAGAQNWYMVDQDATTADAIFSSPPLVTSGVGLNHGTVTFGGALQPLGHTESIALSSTDAGSGFVGVIVQYTQPLTNVLVPITPVRVFDSRFSSKIVQGAPRTINVKDAINVNTGAVTTTNAIPVGTKAISFTLTVTTTGIPGFVSVLPGTTTTVTASTINWTASGATIAAGGTVSLGAGTAERQVTLVVGGAGSASTDVIVDITGYYM